MRLRSQRPYHLQGRRPSSRGHLTGTAIQNSSIAPSVPDLIVDTLLRLSLVHNGPIYNILRCGALDRLRRPGFVSTSSTPFLNDVSTKLLSDTEVCEFDAVIVVDHPGVSPKQNTSPPHFLCRPERAPNLFVPIYSYTRPTCAHFPHPRPSQPACKTLPHPYNFPTCASHHQAPSQTTAPSKISPIS